MDRSIASALPVQLVQVKTGAGPVLIRVAVPNIGGKPPPQFVWIKVFVPSVDTSTTVNGSSKS